MNHCWSCFLHIKYLYIFLDAANGVSGCLCNCHIDAAKHKCEGDSKSAYFPPPEGAAATPCAKGNYGNT